jgi:hypothetical protein
MRRRAFALAAAVALAGCSSGDGDQALRNGPATTDTETVTPTTTSAPPTQPSTTTETLTEPRVTTTTEPGIAPSLPAPRAAPPVRAGTLRFDRIFIFDGGDGRFAGRANVTNSGEDFINGLGLTWRILAADSRELDRGTTSWPNLAPSETATVELRGHAQYSKSWARVVFARAAR